MSSVWHNGIIHLGQGNLQDETIQFAAKSQDFKVKLRVSEKNGDLVLVDSLNRHVFSRKSSKYLWPNRDIKKVHMIFMNHLDIGYTSTWCSTFILHLLITMRLDRTQVRSTTF